MDLGLSRLKVLVTGASKGLGFATARTLAAEGALVAINSRSAERLEAAAAQIGQTGAHPLCLVGDVTDPEMAAQVVNQTASDLGGLDILITNTGGPKPGSFESLTDSDWMNAVNLCLMAHVRLIRAALPHLKQSQHASVLTITSLSVKQPISNLILSNSVRAATAGLTKSLALELGAQGIRFNSILPSWAETERITELMTNRAAANGTTVEEEIARQSKESVFGRMASPDEFARCAAFLVSPAASYLTGVLLPVDGGMNKGTF